jgi:internalin A
MEVPSSSKFAVSIFRRSLCKVILYTMLILTSGDLVGVAIADEVTQPKSFIELCQNQADLSPQTKLTLNALLHHTDATDCRQASEKLQSLSELDLSDRQLSDLTPLATFTQLTRLNLAKNQISDITPLESLTKLTELNLESNQISDLKPLQPLENLKNLNLRFNPIVDYTPLQYLIRLEVVDL